MCKVVIRVLLAVIFSISLSACAERNSVTTDVKELPDYTSWHKEDLSVKAILNGHEVTLTVEDYSHTDLNKLQKSTVSVIYNVNGNVWLALYVEELGEWRKGIVETIEVKYYIYERRNEKWVLTKVFPDSSVIILFDFLKNKYNLEFR